MCCNKSRESDKINQAIPFRSFIKSFIKCKESKLFKNGIFNLSLLFITKHETDFKV